MAATLEDLGRRVTVLEKAAQSEENIVRAVAEIVSASEKRVRADVSELRADVRPSTTGSAPPRNALPTS